jgi:hypothetical protein
MGMNWSANFIFNGLPFIRQQTLLRTSPYLPARSFYVASTKVATQANTTKLTQPVGTELVVWVMLASQFPQPQDGICCEMVGKLLSIKLIPDHMPVAIYSPCPISIPLQTAIQVEITE